MSSTPKEGEALLGDYEKSLVTIGKFDTVRCSSGALFFWVHHPLVDRDLR